MMCRRAPTYPGELLREIVIPALPGGANELRRGLRLSDRDLVGLLEGTERVTPALADRLGVFLGNGPGLWLNMQAAWDEWVNPA
jgi:antitoxin HigA-1